MQKSIVTNKITERGGLPGAPREEYSFVCKGNVFVHLDSTLSHN